MKKFLFLLLVLPLAACFDADLRLTLHEDDTATISSVVKMGPEAYQMAASSGDDPCEDGVGTVLENGSYECRTEETDTLDNIIAQMTEKDEGAEPGDMSPTDSVKVEKLADGLVRVSFDLSDLKQSAGNTGMEPQMLAMLQQAFIGHGISMTIEGSEVIETNGVPSDDGTSARIDIGMDKVLMQDPSVPDSFVTVVRP